MNNIEFNDRFAELRNIPNNKDLFYKSNDIWQHVGKNPLDIQLTKLTELFLEANKRQRKKLIHLFDDNNTWHLIIYIRRISLLIKSNYDVKWLRYGLAIALIENAQYDFRELIISLIILRYATEKNNIKTISYFEEFIKLANNNLKDIFINVRGHSKEDIILTVKEFGSPNS